MNERIKTLMLEHGLHRHISEDCQHRMEFLAELIVRECADVTHRLIVEDGKEFPMKSVAYRLKEHFGIDQTKREKFDRAMQDTFANGVDLSGRETP